ncbi:MAG: methyltransferase type 11 [Microgenomates group bacterium Gr01-1014_5]|nr:MAG: methyltransferase type 11 [Microgenomates group bacterium Gr01-1014_5]
MQLSEYKNIFDNEEHHFFYVGNRLVILNLVKKYTQGKKSLNILDAGCGTGMLAKKLQTIGRVTGVDISPEAIKYAQQRDVQARLASVTELPFKDNTFDLIVSIDVLYHQLVNNDLKAISEFKRVLKPRGVLILKVPAYNWLRGSHDIVVHTKHRYTANELKQLTTKTGLKILKASYFASFLLPLAIVKRLIESVMRPKHAGSDVSSPPYFLNTLIVALYKLESFLLNFVNIPFGLSALVVAQKPQATKYPLVKSAVKTSPKTKNKK